MPDDVMGNHAKDDCHVQLLHDGHPQGPLMRDRRRLAAIVSTDVVGYSRLMGRDESGTLAALKAHRQALIDPKIAEYGGRIVKSTGDGLLLEFPSVVDAVRCAVDMQRGMAERNAGVPAENRVELRVGINIGDIIIDGDDIFGDGVNVAARLQTLADPGGICVSRIVRDQVVDKLSFSFEDLGAKAVKNIARPVEVYRVQLGGRTPSEPSGRKRIESLSRSLRRRWPVIAVLALGVVGVGLWAVSPGLWKSAPAPTPPALSVAILPFTAPGGTVAEQKLADGLSRDLTAALGQWRFATVAPYRSSVTPSSGSSDVQMLAHQLNVRFLTQGEVQRAGDQLIVTTQLVDVANGNQVWSERLVFEQSRVAQDAREVVTKLDQRLRDALERAESRRAGAATADGASAVELTLRAWSMENRAGAPLAARVEAGALYDKAIHLDPNFATAMVARVDNLHNQLLFGRMPADQRQRIVAQMDDLSRRALAIDDKYPGAWYARSLALYRQGRLQGALEANAQYVKLDPNRFPPLAQRAWFMLFTGRAEEAIDLLNEALARGLTKSLETHFALQARCAIELRLGRYEDTIADCERALAYQDSWFEHSLLAAAYAQTGKLDRAAVEKDRLLSLRSWFSIAEEKAGELSDNPTYLRQTESHFYAGLRKAGVPEK
jgi:adenylate cyclase